MTQAAPLPSALRPFVDFASVLRGNGFAVAPDQTIGFVRALGALGPRSIDDVHHAARALFAVPPERFEAFDALFRAFFLGQTASAPAHGDEGEEVEAHEASGADTAAELDEAEDSPGAEAAAAERLGHRDLAAWADDALRRLARDAPRRLPQRLSRRRISAPLGDRPDMRRALRDAARRDGELFTLPMTRRRLRQRRIVLLIDVSGSMSERTEPALRFAHGLSQAARQIEVFTLGTRLTRITAALRPQAGDLALPRAAALIADIDGGTRIGEALQTFLAVPRYAGFARGALVLVLSDGLERGDPAAMIEGTRRLARLAWRLHWLSPLAGSDGYRPETAGLAAILPDLDAFAPGGNIATLTDHVLNAARWA
ncbi:MAG: VWA domain-containing protein [Pseudomonadota bacterium]